MDINHHIWRDWAKIIHRWGFTQIVVSFFEKNNPLVFLIGQGIYLFEPMLSMMLSPQSVSAIAELLNNDHQVTTFIEYLKKTSQEP